MPTVFSANAFSPVVPDLNKDLTQRNDFAENLSTPLSEKGGTAINFARPGGQGTPLENLLSEPNGGSQQLSQLVAEIIKAILPLIQQLLQSQQADNNGESGNSAGNHISTGNGNSVGGVSAGTGNMTDNSGAISNLNATNINSAGTPVNFASGNPAASSGSPSTANGAAPTAAVSSEMLTLSTASAQQSSATTGGSPSLSTGSSDLHLPAALKDYEGDIQHAAQATGVPANVLAAQIWQESRGSLGAATVNGGNGLQDAGLMQVNSNTFADLQSKNPGLLGADANPNNARDNIMAGALYMKEQLKDFDGNMGAALRAYNSGPGNVNTANLSDISKTGTGDATYVDKVMDFANTIATGKGTLPA